MSVKKTVCALIAIFALAAAPVSAIQGGEEAVLPDNAADMRGEAVDPLTGAADMRGIYVGDIVKLEIATRLNADELAEQFADFEITELNNIPGGYALSVRTFITGEHTIPLGDTELVIEVRSALTDIARGDIFESDAAIPPGFYFHWRELFIIALGCFLISGGIALARHFLNGKTKKTDPRRLFMARSGALSEYDENYFVDLTFYFKEYLGSLTRRRIVGKTSDEIVAEIEGAEPIVGIIPEIGGWLARCDTMKFAGISPSAEDKRGHYSELIDLVRDIDDRYGRAAEEARA